MSRHGGTSASPPAERWPETDHPPWQEDSLEDLLDLLPELDARVSDAVSELRACVEVLRRRRASWREIGDALNVSRQAAWQRFHGSGAGNAD